MSGKFVVFSIVEIQIVVEPGDVLPIVFAARDNHRRRYASMLAEYFQDRFQMPQ